MGGGSAIMRRGHRAQTPTPPGPLTIPAYWGFGGDSQTDGREAEATNAKSPIEAFHKIWIDSGFTAPSSLQKHGLSSRSLQETVNYIDGFTYAGTPWIHMQESGGQSDAGQTTSSEFGATFQAAWQTLAGLNPGGLYTYETAYSFQRDAEPGRNWDSYNTEMRARVVTLAGLGIVVKIAETDANIKTLVTAIGYSNVCFTSGGNIFHYRGTGNLMVALGYFQMFNYSPASLVLTNIDVPYKTECLAVIGG